MFIEKFTYGYNDVFIQPAHKSSIEHRAECNVFKNGMLPIFTAPMSTVVSDRNAHMFEDNKIIPIIPRHISWETRNKYLKEGKWIACSMSEFKDILSYYNEFKTPAHILIDVANGNMSQLFTLCSDAKSKYGKNNIILMTGNIANPNTYRHYCKAGVDYVRCGIGGGDGCITSSNCAIHYGIVNLLAEIDEVRRQIEKEMQFTNTNYKCVTKVVADGGIRNYDDVIKALALGADYVMIGSVFASLVESCAPTYYYDRNKELHSVDPLDPDVHITKIDTNVFSYTVDTGTEGSNHIIDGLYKVFYGMASKRGQEDMFGKKTHTSEGVIKNIPCTTNINKWTENMIHNLSTAMSYCNVQDVNNFNTNTINVYLASNNLKQSINK